MCIVEGDGGVVDRKTIEHTGAGMAQLVKRLEELTGVEPGLAAVGIEAPRGAIVECLIEHRFNVYSINPKQMDRFRDPHTIAGAKHDRRDDGDSRFAPIGSRAISSCATGRPAGDAHSRELSRTEQDIQQQQTRVSNQLRDLLPQLTKVSPGLDEGWLWDLLELARQPRRKRGN